MIDQNLYYDFPDLPREIFYKIIKNEETNSKLSKTDIENFREKISKMFDPRTDVEKFLILIIINNFIKAIKSTRL